MAPTQQTERHLQLVSKIDLEGSAVDEPVEHAKVIRTYIDRGDGNAQAEIGEIAPDALGYDAESDLITATDTVTDTIMDQLFKEDEAGARFLAEFDAIINGNNNKDEAKPTSDTTIEPATEPTDVQTLTREITRDDDLVPKFLTIGHHDEINAKSKPNRAANNAPAAALMTNLAEQSPSVTTDTPLVEADINGSPASGDHNNETKEPTDPTDRYPEFTYDPFAMVDNGNGSSANIPGTTHRNPVVAHHTIDPDIESGASLVETTSLKIVAQSQPAPQATETAIGDDSSHPKLTMPEYYKQVGDAYDDELDRVLSELNQYIAKDAQNARERLEADDHGPVANQNISTGTVLTEEKPAAITPQFQESATALSEVETQRVIDVTPEKLADIFQEVDDEQATITQNPEGDTSDEADGLGLEEVLKADNDDKDDDPARNSLTIGDPDLEPTDTAPEVPGPSGVILGGAAATVRLRNTLTDPNATTTDDRPIGWDAGVAAAMATDLPAETERKDWGTGATPTKLANQGFSWTRQPASRPPMKTPPMPPVAPSTLTATSEFVGFDSADSKREPLFDPVTGLPILDDHGNQRHMLFANHWDGIPAIDTAAARPIVQQAGITAEDLSALAPELQIAMDTPTKAGRQLRKPSIPHFMTKAGRSSRRAKRTMPKVVNKRPGILSEVSTSILSLIPWNERLGLVRPLKVIDQ